MKEPTKDQACKHGPTWPRRKHLARNTDMREVIITKEPVTLKGNFAILSKELIKRLEENREEELRYQQSRLKDSNHYTIKPAPWVEVTGNTYRTEFEWNIGKEPEIVDQDYQSIPGKTLTADSCITAKLIFVQKGFAQDDGHTIGTSLHLKGLQVISASSNR